MKKLKELLKESYVWERKFGEKLPTLADIQKKKLNEVGNAPRHKKWMMEVERGEGYYRSIVENYATFLKEQGHQKEAKELMSKYVTLTGKFSHWMKTKWTRIIRKLI